MSNEFDLSGFENRSILIIDDNHALHRDYYAVLRPDQRGEDEAKLDELEEFLLGPDENAPSNKALRNFELQSAYQGEEAYELVKKHEAKGIRYPLAFVDMRMPPGWDGLETIKRIREIDEDMSFIIVSAYSDYSELEISEQLGSDKLVKLICKPFDPAEIYALSYQIIADWNGKQK